jgi:hypothetical protein
MNLIDYVAEHPALKIICEEAAAIEDQSASLDLRALTDEGEVQEMIEAIIASSKHLLENAEYLLEQFRGYR